MKLLRKIRSLFRKDKLDAEMTAEMRHHLEEQTRRNVRAGMALTEAVSAAQRQFGNVASIQEQAREARGWTWLEQFGQDSRWALRALGKTPGFTFVAVLTLALAIGATTTVFSVAYAVLLRPLPFPESERLGAIWTRTPQAERMGMAAANHLDLKARSAVFEDIALVRTGASTNLIGEGEPERLLAARVAANLFPVLRVGPALGRGFTADECQPGRDRVVVLSHALWQRRYAGNPDMVGKAINLDGVPHTVVGVMAAGFQFPSRYTQIWLPLTINPRDFTTRSGYGHMAIARLLPGVSWTEAQTEVTGVAARLATQFPQSNRDVRFDVGPLREHFAEAAEQPLSLLLGASLGLLLIGCCNLANLLFARALARNRETAVRAALGASRSRLLRQAVAELLPILALGGLAGVVAAQAGLKLALPILPASLPRLEEIQVSLPVLLTSAGLQALAAGLVLLWPATQAARPDLAEILRADQRTTSGVGGAVKIQRLMLVGQVALAVVLLAGAGLLIRSFAALQEVNPGYHPDGVLVARLAIPRSKYRDDAQVAAFSGRVLEAIRALPGIEAAGMSNRLPLGEAAGPATIEFERPGQEPGKLEATDETTVTPDYFRALGVPLQRGRSLGEQETAAAPWAVVVDEEVARRAWPGEDPVGKRVRSDPRLPWAEVVGVVGHVRHESLDRDQRRQIYWNYLQRPRDRMTIVVRTAGDARLLAGPVLAALKTVDPDQPAFGVRTMSDVLDQSVALRRFNTGLVALFATSSLLLATVGIYGVIAWSVRQRTREIGIRIALGATRASVIGLVLRNGLRFVGWGIALGLMGAAGLSTFLRSMLFAVSPMDPVTFAAVPVAFVAATLFACWLPARRATKVDPVVALRAE